VTIHFWEEERRSIVATTPCTSPGKKTASGGNPPWRCACSGEKPFLARARAEDTEHSATQIGRWYRGEGYRRTLEYIRKTKIPRTIAQCRAPFQPTSQVIEQPSSQPTIPSNQTPPPKNRLEGAKGVFAVVGGDVREVDGVRVGVELRCVQCARHLRRWKQYRSVN